MSNQDKTFGKIEKRSPVKNFCLKSIYFKVRAFYLLLVQDYKLVVKSLF